nr:AlpA family transcriptional regulator [Klebsiella variicola]
MAYMTNDSGFTNRYFYKQIKLGKLPPPIKFGRSSRWLLGDYIQWRDLHQRISQ